jgi:hypothetical protein
MRRRKLTPEQIKRSQERYPGLSQPITKEDILYHAQFLCPVNFGHGYCWIYVRKSTGGASGSYSRLKFRKVWVGAHRFALAVKLGCTLWDLEGYDAAHAPSDICVGGRCCNPEHLSRKLSDANRSWDRAKDLAKFGQKLHRSKAQQLKMIKAMYPTGLKLSGTLPPDFKADWSPKKRF